MQFTVGRVTQIKRGYVKDLEPLCITYGRASGADFIIIQNTSLITNKPGEEVMSHSSTVVETVIALKEPSTFATKSVLNDHTLSPCMFANSMRMVSLRLKS